MLHRPPFQVVLVDGTWELEMALCTKKGLFTLAWYDDSIMEPWVV